MKTINILYYFHIEFWAKCLDFQLLLLQLASVSHTITQHHHSPSSVDCPPFANRRHRPFTAHKVSLFTYLHFQLKSPLITNQSIHSPSPISHLLNTSFIPTTTPLRRHSPILPSLTTHSKKTLIQCHDQRVQILNLRS